MNIVIAPENIVNFDMNEMQEFQDLIDIYNVHSMKNVQKQKYYDGKISVNDVNLGLALPQNLGGLDIGRAWGAKTVDVLAAMSRFWTKSC